MYEWVPVKVVGETVMYVHPLKQIGDYYRVYTHMWGGKRVRAVTRHGDTPVR